MGGFLSHEGGGEGVRGGLTFVTKKVVFLNEGFPYLNRIIACLKCLNSLCQDILLQRDPKWESLHFL